MRSCSLESPMCGAVRERSLQITPASNALVQLFGGPCVARRWHQNEIQPGSFAAGPRSLSVQRQCGSKTSSWPIGLSPLPSRRASVNASNEAFGCRRRPRRPERGEMPPRGSSGRRTGLRVGCGVGPGGAPISCPQVLRGSLASKVVAMTRPIVPWLALIARGRFALSRAFAPGLAL